jgi:hypothetical protein
MDAMIDELTQIEYNPETRRCREKPLFFRMPLSASLHLCGGFSG